MTSGITSETLQEHGHLVDTIDKLAESIRSLPKDVQWGSSQWAQDMEIFDFIRIQALSMQNAENNAVRGCYRDAYHLIRMVFEGYFILRLVSTCDKYPMRVRIRKAVGDSTPEEAKTRAVETAQKHFGGRLIRTYMEDKNILVCVLRGTSVVDNQGHDTGVVIPFYYRAWHGFRPLEYHLKRKTLQERLPTLRFLAGEWASGPKRARNYSEEDYGALYRHFLTFDKVLENLRLNAVLNKKTTTRVLVHYNFLSNFSHTTSDSLSILRNRLIGQTRPDGLDVIYDHYLSELALLYHLLSMHLEHAVRYLRWRRIALKHEGDYRALGRQVEDEFGYFWFIFNKPHQHDRYCHANRKWYREKGLFYRPEDIRLGDVRYYDDPLWRLKQLHQSQRELLTGNDFISPFPREDASF